MGVVTSIFLFPRWPGPVRSWPQGVGGGYVWFCPTVLNVLEGFHFLAASSSVFVVCLSCHVTTQAHCVA